METEKAERIPKVGSSHLFGQPVYLPLDKHENDRQDRSPCPSEIIELRQELRYIFSDASGMETFVDSIFRREQE